MMKQLFALIAAAVLALPVFAQTTEETLVKVQDFAVFVDPPTGFEFVKMPAGWKFGRVSAVATNAQRGHIWEQYSSETFKELPSPGVRFLYNPYNPLIPIVFNVPQGSGYYRTPSLASIWATAPLLHNNALGKFTGDPSVKGRLDAFDDAITKLLWPAQRLNTIKRTSVDSVLTLPVGAIQVKAGTPVNLLANVDPRPIQNQLGMVTLGLVGPLGLTPDNPVVATTLLTTFSQVPDLIEDEGHYFGNELSDGDKRALIAFLKTL